MWCRRKCIRSRIAAANRSRCAPNSPRASRVPISPMAGSSLRRSRSRRTAALFRYERPQKGRYRQFHQLDAEAIGSDSPLADAELLVFADQLLKELGIAEGVTLTLNTLGDAESRDAWRAALVEHFEAHRGELSGRQPCSARQESAPHPRQQGSEGSPGRRQRARHRRVPHERSAGLLRRRHRGPRRRGRRMGAQRAPRARARLLSPHRVRVRHRPAGGAGHGARRRAL